MCHHYRHAKKCAGNISTSSHLHFFLRIGCLPEIPPPVLLSCGEKFLGSDDLRPGCALVLDSKPNWAKRTRIFLCLKAKKRVNFACFTSKLTVDLIRNGKKDNWNENAHESCETKRREKISIRVLYYHQTLAPEFYARSWHQTVEPNFSTWDSKHKLAVQVEYISSNLNLAAKVCAEDVNVIS